MPHYYHIDNDFHSYHCYFFSSWKIFICGGILIRNGTGMIVFICRVSTTMSMGRWLTWGYADLLLLLVIVAIGAANDDNEDDDVESNSDSDN